MTGVQACALPIWGEAQYHVEVVTDTGQEVVVEVLGGRGAAGVLAFHGGDQVLGDLIQLVSREQVRHLGHTEDRGCY